MLVIRCEWCGKLFNTHLFEPTSFLNFMLNEHTNKIEKFVVHLEINSCPYCDFVQVKFWENRNVVCE